MSIAPASTRGWLATTPTGWPASRPSPTTMFWAKKGCTSRKRRSSSTLVTTSRMSYGRLGFSGTIVWSSGSPRSGSSAAVRRGGCSLLEAGR